MYVTILRVNVIRSSETWRGSTKTFYASVWIMDRDSMIFLLIWIIDNNDKRIKQKQMLDLRSFCYHGYHLIMTSIWEGFIHVHQSFIQQPFPNFLLDFQEHVHNMPEYRST